MVAPTFKKYDPVTHPEIKLIEDWNALYDYVIALDGAVGEIQDPITDTPTFTLATGDSGYGTNDFKCWINITVDRMEMAGGYLVGYKRNSDSIYSTAAYSQPANTESTFILQTPDLSENTLYDVKVCALSKLGGMSPWSTVQSITTSSNNIVYPVPSEVVATPVLDAVLLNWLDISSLGYKSVRYNIYHSTTDLIADATVISTSNSPWYTWNVVDPTANYAPQYFWITTLSPSNLESEKSDMVTATPVKLKPIELDISTLAWKSNFRIWEDSVTYGKIYWADQAKTSDATITYEDTTTETITKNLTGTTYTAGLRYFYNVKGSPSLLSTSVHTVAIDKLNNLVAIIDVKTDAKSTIQLYNSYVPTLGFGGLVGKTIVAESMVLDEAIITNGLQLGDGIIENRNLNGSISLAASQIYLRGAITIATTDPIDGLTKINGSEISTSTIKGTAVDPANPISSDRILNINANQVKISGTTYFDSLFHTGTTMIEGSAIYTASLTVSSSNLDVTLAAQIAAAVYAGETFDTWKYVDSGTTYINGGLIFTGTIYADSIHARTITSSEVDVIGGRALEVVASEVLQHQSTYNGSILPSATTYVKVSELTLDDGDIKTGCRIKFYTGTDGAFHADTVWGKLMVQRVGAPYPVDIGVEFENAWNPSILDYDTYSQDFGEFYEGDKISLWIKYGTHVDGTFAGTTGIQVYYSTYCGRTLSG